MIWKKLHCATQKKYTWAEYLVFENEKWKILHLLNFVWKSDFWDKCAWKTVFGALSSFNKS